MGLLFRLAELLIVLLPLAGVLMAAVRAFTNHQRRALQPPPLDRPQIPDNARTGNNPAAQWSSLRRVIEEHNRTDERWLDYELDVAKLLDFPLMTDMRDPLTIAFHKAKLRAEFLRPAKAEDLLDDPEAAAGYRAAVEDYVTAFNVAESEAMRKRRTGFSRAEQQRIARAQSLAGGVGVRGGAAGTTERLRRGPQGTRRPGGAAGHHAAGHRTRDFRGDSGVAPGPR
jgi:hypothetical protein